MKQAIYSIIHKVLFGNPDRQLFFLTSENQQLPLVHNSFSPEFLSTSSPVMAMCCCCCTSY